MHTKNLRNAIKNVLDSQDFDVEFYYDYLLGELKVILLPKNDQYFADSGSVNFVMKNDGVFARHPVVKLRAGVHDSKYHAEDAQAFHNALTAVRNGADYVFNKQMTENDRYDLLKELLQ